MVEQSRRDRVGLGLIGVGPSWEALYRPSIARLQNRLTIRLVYDPVEARARSVASEWGAEVVSSLYQAINRHKLQGLLVLDAGWCGSGIVRLLASSGKQVYVSRPALSQAMLVHSKPMAPPEMEQRNGHAPLLADHWMPELRLRFTPASCRLRELIATRLGPVVRIAIDCDPAGGKAEIAELVDWCIDIMGSEPTMSQRQPSQDSIQLGFPLLHSQRSVSPSQRLATLRPAVNGDPALKIEVECVQGRATLRDRTRISWHSGQDAADELLTDERTEIEILIDQFCRRALGGLNPVGRLSEFLRATELVEQFHGQLS